MRQSDTWHRPAYLPSLWDRLQDDVPSQRSEHPQAYAPDDRGMRRIIRRDLGLLLSTTNLHDELDEARYPDAAASVINYGMPPLSGSYATDFSWEKLEARILAAVTAFEPRLMPDTLRIRPLRDTDPRRYNKLMFEIEGQMQWSPYPLEFRIQSTFDLEMSKVTLHSADDAGNRR